jgi:DNA modification methylase
LLSKKPKYYYDHNAIKEPHKWSHVGEMRKGKESKNGGSIEEPIKGRGNTTGSFRAFGEGGKNKRSVWTVTTKPFRGAHFATFPKELIEPCVLAGCPKGGTVFDPFTGSGTTAVVALNNERNYIGTELNPDYIALAEGRIRDEVTASLSEFLA